MALREQHWHVHVTDRDPGVTDRAVRMGAADAVGPDPEADLVVVAVPVGAAPGLIATAMETCPKAVVTDTGSVKASVVAWADHPRFVGGHPMAGSEREGLDGADSQLFTGATWVLTPTALTDSVAFATVRSVATSLGAEVVAVDPSVHDDLVATVSHVPHLTAAALMGLADDVSAEHATVLRLAAGGFRDMTRIAAGAPDIWLDICEDNRLAIVSTLRSLEARLGAIRSVVEAGDREGLYLALTKARTARVSLPARAAARPEALVEVRTPIEDKPGQIAEISTLLGELSINIFDLELAHSAGAGLGTMVLVIDAAHADLCRGALFARGYRTAIRKLTD